MGGDTVAVLHDVIGGQAIDHAERDAGGRRGDCTNGDDDEVQRWRARMNDAGIWANDPVPLYPYPGSPDYTRLWGLPDDDAWERALDYYLDRYAAFSDIQEAQPRRLGELEIAR